MLFDWLITGHVVSVNPAATVHGPKLVVKSRTTPVLEGGEWRKLIDSIPADTVRDLRDRALFEKHRASACAGTGIEHQQGRARFCPAPVDKGGRAAAARRLLLPPVRRPTFVDRGSRRLLGGTDFYETQDTGLLLARLDELWRRVPRTEPLSVGVVLLDLVPTGQHQPDLFDAANQWRQKLSPMIDRINTRYGRGAVGFGLLPPTVRAFSGHAAFRRGLYHPTQIDPSRTRVSPSKGPESGRLELTRRRTRRMLGIALSAFGVLPQPVKVGHPGRANKAVPAG
jgi:hypothetical protein